MCDAHLNDLSDSFLSVWVKFRVELKQIHPNDKRW